MGDFGIIYAKKFNTEYVAGFSVARLNPPTSNIMSWANHGQQYRLDSSIVRKARKLVSKLIWRVVLAYQKVRRLIVTKHLVFNDNMSLVL